MSKAPKGRDRTVAAWQVIESAQQAYRKKKR